MEKSNTSGEKSKSPAPENDDISSTDGNFNHKAMVPLPLVENGRDEKFEIDSDASPH
jgi:hypothetical protein